MKQLDVVVESNFIFSQEFGPLTDGQKAIYKSPPCLRAGGLKRSVKIFGIHSLYCGLIEEIMPKAIKEIIVSSYPSMIANANCERP